MKIETFSQAELGAALAAQVASDLRAGYCIEGAREPCCSGRDDAWTIFVSAE